MTQAALNEAIQRVLELHATGMLNRWQISEDTAISINQDFANLETAYKHFQVHYSELTEDIKKSTKQSPYIANLMQNIPDPALAMLEIECTLIPKMKNVVSVSYHVIKRIIAALKCVPDAESLVDSLKQAKIYGIRCDMTFTVNNNNHEITLWDPIVSQFVKYIDDIQPIEYAVVIVLTHMHAAE